MKILVTGGSGFLGRHLLPLLEETNAVVHHLVRESRGLRNEHLWDFSSALPEEIPPCNIVVHLAACVHFGPQMSVEQYKVNTVSAIRLGGYCRHHNAHMILASMTGVHGNQELIDSKTPVRPESHYGMSKYLAEEVVRGFVRRQTILRISGIYGLDGPAHLGLNNAISNAFHQGIVPQLKGRGRGRRNYICVDDAANWLLSIIDRVQNKEAASDGERRQEIVYMAGNEVLSIAGYLHAIVDVLLPGQAVCLQEGVDSADSIIKASTPPFPLKSFRDYLQDLSEKKLQQSGKPNE